jgi:hypothetical protein
LPLQLGLNLVLYIPQEAKHSEDSPRTDTYDKMQMYRPG